MDGEKTIRGRGFTMVNLIIILHSFSSQQSFRHLLLQGLHSLFSFFSIFNFIFCTSAPQHFCTSAFPSIIMKSTVFTALAAFFAQSSASVIPSIRSPITPGLLHARQNSTNSTTSCTNTATSRNCWGDYSIDTNWYDVTPNTGVTRGL
jgi:hypothetical protein